MQAIFQPFPMLPGRNAQVWHHHPSFLRPRHFHAEPELNVVTRGVGLLSVGNQTLRLTAGDVVLLQPGQDHELLWESPDFELFVLAVTPALADRADVLLPRGGQGVVALGSPLMSALRHQWMDVGKINDAASVEAQLCDAFKHLAHRFDAPPALCRRALQTLHADPGSSEQHLAATLKSHASSISRSFRAHTGVRLVEYRSRMRLMAFVRQVDAGATMTNAAFASGFGSYAQLHRAFHKHFTCTPADYFGGKRQVVDALLRRDVARAPHIAAPREG